MRLAIPDGRLPLLARDGLTCACGTNQAVQVDIRTGQTDVLMRDAASCGFHHGQIAISKYVAGGRELVHGPITPPVDQNPGYMPQRAVVNGWVVSSARGQHFINGQPVTTYDPVQSTIEDFDGWHYCYKEHEGVWPLVVRNVETQAEVMRIDWAISNSVVWTDANGRPWVFANFDGAAVLYRLDGTLAQRFQQGEYRGALSDGPTQPWAWTCGQFTDGSPFICGRPFSDLSGPGIILRGLWWAGLAVVWRPTDQRWTVAGYYDGQGGVLDIDPDVNPAQPREVLDLGHSQPLPPVPPVEPAPPALVPCKVSQRPMFYANGDLKVTVRAPKGQLPTPKVGDVIEIVRPI
jgi:hypothetical protein